jgi:hypothetical protein
MRMTDEYVDPSGTTDQFKAFVQSDSPEAPARARLPVIIGGLAAIIAIAVVLVILLVG